MSTAYLAKAASVAPSPPKVVLSPMPSIFLSSIIINIAVLLPFITVNFTIVLSLVIIDLAVSFQLLSLDIAVPSFPYY